MDNKKKVNRISRALLSNFYDAEVQQSAVQMQTDTSSSLQD